MAVTKFDKLRMADAVYIATIATESKRGQAAYKSWIKDNLPKDESDVKQETLFEKAKRLRGK